MEAALAAALSDPSHPWIPVGPTAPLGPPPVGHVRVPTLDSGWSASSMDKVRRESGAFGLRSMLSKWRREFRPQYDALGWPERLQPYVAEVGEETIA
jgi:hypothetical protein